MNRADVLVVGGGLAAMAAALEASDGGAQVVVAYAGEGSSELAQGGMAAAVGEDDSPGRHAADTVAAGAGLCDEAAVGELTQKAPGAVAWLRRMGVVFDRDPSGDLALGLEAAHSRARVLHAGGDSSGAAIVAAVQSRLSGRVTLVPGARLIHLLARRGVVAGGRFQVGAERHDILAPATVLATGGYAGLFPRTTTTGACDGSGLLAALAAGAELADLELVQYHPTAYAGPGRSFLLTEALRGAGGWLVDAAGSRFLFDVDERGELAPRAVVSRAIAERLAVTGESSVYLDARPIGEERLHRDFPGFLARCRRVGLDPLQAPVPVAPAAHYTMGGVVTDLEAQTGVPGLLAAGECARTGVHGANRLASNSLVEAIVFGRRAGQAALRPSPAHSGEHPVQLGEGRPWSPAAEERAALGLAAGPLRSAAGLRRAQAVLAAAAPNGLAALVIGAALIREESRGAHVRTDHPVEQPVWAALEVVATAEDGLRVRRRQEASRPERDLQATASAP